MANITLMIGGREFMLACADGEEEHVRMLGRLIDAKVLSSGAVGQTEPRMLLFAALMMADELHEIQKSPPPAITSPPVEPAAIEAPKVQSNAASLPPEFADRVARIAAQVENLADLLETEAANA